MELNASLLHMHQFLLAKGISKAIVDEILEGLRLALKSKAGFEKHLWLSILNRLLSEALHTSAGFHLTGSKVIALVGPTGIGKTTTLIKLSEFLSEKNKKVALLCLDHEKAGSSIPVEKSGEGDLFYRKEQCPFADYDITLIDTAGCNYYEPHRVEEVGNQLSTISEVEIHLVLSAAAKEVDLYGAIHQFSSLKPKSLIFTKLDETLAPGVLVNISSKVEMPISYIAYGYPLPGKIEEAVSAKIAHKILTDFNDRHFHLLRQLYMAGN